VVNAIKVKVEAKTAYKEFTHACNKKIDKEVTAIIKDIDREMA
jgi:hypothetical protein